MTGSRLELDGVTKSIGGRRILDEVSLAVAPGDLLGLIGPNGAGKTTLFDIICGYTAADAGGVRVCGRRLDSMRPHEIAGLGVGRTFQHPRGGMQLTALENVVLYAGHQRGEEMRWALAGPRFWRSREAVLNETALGILEELGVRPVAAEKLGALSFGQHKLIALACVMMARPVVFLLDEPLAGLAAPAAELAAGAILRRVHEGATAVIIEHDLEALASLCERVTFLDAGRIVVSGSMAGVRQDPRVLDAYLE